MPDIFGRERRDYEHIRALDDAGEGLYERHAEAHANAMGLPDGASHDFDALGSAERQGYQNLGGEDSEQHRSAINAQAIGFATTNMLAIQSVVDEILYTGYRGDEFVPMADGIPEGATAYTPRIVDVHGRAKFLNNRGDEAEAVRISETTNPQPILMGGVDAEWTIRDLRSAMFSGTPLQTLTMEGGIDRCFDHVEKVQLVGDTDNDWHGLTNLTNAVDGITTSAFTGTFAGSTALQIQAAVSGQISALITDTNEVVGRRLKDGLCVYLPGAEYDRLCNPLGDNADKSIMDWLEGMNPFTKMTGNKIQFKRLMELTSKMITTVKSNKVFEHAIPIMPRVVRILDMGRVITAQMEYEMGRLYIKRPPYIRVLTAI